MISLIFFKDVFLPEFYDVYGKFEPLWLFVFGLAVLIALIPIFERIKFVAPGKTLFICEMKTIIDLTLWLDYEGKSVRLSEVCGVGFYAERIDNYRVLVSGLSEKQKGNLVLTTNCGIFEFGVEYGMFSYIIHLVHEGERYFQYERDKYAVVGDVMRGYDLTLANVIESDVVYHDYLSKLENRLVDWHKSVKAGELIRKAAKNQSIPMGLVKYFAKVGKVARLNCDKDRDLRLLASEGLAMPNLGDLVEVDKSFLQFYD